MQLPGALGNGSEITAEEFEKVKVDGYNALPGELKESDGFYHCSLCNDKGIYAYLAYNETLGRKVETYTICKCSQKRQNLRRLIRSGLGEAIKKCTFDNYQTVNAWQKTVKEKAQRFCNAGAQCFFIGGQSGAGKTHLCTAISMALFEQDKNIKYMIWPEEVPRMQGLVNDPVKYTEMMHELKTVDVLYIDDLFKNGSENGRLRQPSGAETKRAFEIINQRGLSSGKITIISSEFTIRDLLSIDEAFAGRINEKANNGEYCINISRDMTKNWRMRNMLEV